MVILRCQGVFVFFYDFLCTTAAMRSFFMPGKIKVYVLKIPLPSGHKKRVPTYADTPCCYSVGGSQWYISCCT